ncbi:MAG TPA: protein kinase [Vicinamibacteria bacterium]|nr:protein kinase [Vicinamibacteria bacterium]
MDRLGQGGMGTVYRARDPVLDRPVALKTISAELAANPEFLGRFQREARAAARLTHPNIVTIYELGDVAGTPYIAMELLEGLDLVEAMSPADRLPVDDKLRIMVEVCRGLDYAHKRGVIHRDVKPANVRLLADGTVKLVDFGIARLGESTLTQTGILLGTPSYLAPEVVSGGRVDHRADMWAVGIILYELLSGQRPFHAPTFVGLVYKIVHEPVPPLESVATSLPPGMAQVVARTLEKDPSKRYQDLAELAAAIQAVRGVKDTTQPTLSPQARDRAVDLEIAQVRRLMEANDLERALEAARRAQALAPSRTEVVALIEQIEMYLSDATPPARPETTLPAIESTVLATPTPSKPRLPTPVLTELRARGASVFRELATFGEPPATQALARSPVDDLLATAGADGAVRLWDLQSRTRRQSLRTDMHKRAGHDARALTLAFSPDGSLLASGHVDGSIHLWDMASGEEMRVRLRHEEEMVSALAFSPDGRTLASGGVDSTLKLWDVPAARRGEARRELVREPAAVTALSFVAGGKLLVTGHANRILRVMDVATRRLTATLRGPEALVNVLCASPDGRRLAVGSHDRTVRVYDIESQAQVAISTPHKKPATSLCFFADGSHLASVALENMVHLWDLESAAPVASLWGPNADSFAGITLYGEGDHIAVALADGRIRVWGPAS